MTIRHLTYHRIPADKVRQLMGTGTKPLPFGEVSLIEEHGVVLIAEANSPGSAVYTGYTFSDYPGIGKLDVLYPKAGMTNHGYVTSEAAAK